MDTQNGRVSALTGRKYCSQMKVLYLLADTDMAFLDRHEYQMETACESCGADVLVSVKELEKIYAPDFRAEQDGNRITIFHRGISVAFEEGSRNAFVEGNSLYLAEAPRNGMIPVMEVMASVYAKGIDRKGDFVAISEEKGYKLDRPANVIKNFHNWHKSNGELFRTIWEPEAEKLNTYRLYVPSSYEEGQKSKLVVVLHGAGGNEDGMFERGPKLEFYAEDRGYILLGVNSVVVTANFGGLLPPQGAFPINPDKAVIGNAGCYTPEQEEENHIVEKLVFDVIDKVVKEYNVDPDQIFVMGNSMGGIGTFFLPSARPGFFKAMVPAGALPEIDYLPLEAYEGVPIMEIMGTEDHNWYQRVQRSVKILQERGLNIKLRTIGGGDHPTAWTYVIDEIFDFFDETGR